MGLCYLVQRVLEEFDNFVGNAKLRIHLQQQGRSVLRGIRVVVYQQDPDITLALLLDVMGHLK